MRRVQSMKSIEQRRLLPKYGEAEIIYAHAVERNHIRVYIYKED